MITRLAGIFVVLVTAPFLAAAKKPVTLQTLIDAPPARFPSVNWAPDGTRFLTTERNTVTLYDVKSGKSREVTAISKLEGAAVKVPAPAQYEWTDRRVAESSVQWFGDGKRLLVSAGGDLFIV